MAMVPMLGVSDAWSFMIVGIVALCAYARDGQGVSGFRSLTRSFKRA